MTRERRSAQISVGDLGRFVVNTRRGRAAVAVFLAAAALLGLLLSFVGASELVSTLAVVAFVVTAVPIIFMQLTEATRPPDDRRS